MIISEEQVMRVEMQDGLDNARVQAAGRAGAWLGQFAARAMAVVSVAAALTLGAQALTAQEAGEVLLTVHGGPDGATVMTFDLAALDALEQQSFVTTTTWTVGENTFSGPSLRAVLDAAGIPEGDIEAEAENDYRIVIPAADIEDSAPIIATRIDGETFNRREKGPLWVMFPFDSDVDYRSERVYALAVWQLLEIKPSLD